MDNRLFKKIFDSFRQMFVGTSFQVVFTIIAGYLFALILGPSKYGIWQTARVFIGYGSFINLGIPYIVQRDFPAFRKEGRLQEASNIANQVFSLTIISFPLFALVFILYSIFANHTPDFTKSLYVVGLYFILSIPAGIGTVMNKSVNDYSTVGKAGTILGLGTLLIVPFVYFKGFDALLIGFLVVTLAVSIWYYLNRPIEYKWFWNTRLLKKMVSSSFPLFLVHVSTSVFASVDRLIIAAFLGFKEVGFYSLSSFIATPISVMMRSLSVVMFTQINEFYGKSKTEVVIKNQVLLPQGFFSVLLPPIIGFIIIALPILIHYFLPQYKDGIFAAQINIFSTFFFLLASFSSNALFILDKQVYSAISFIIAGVIKSLGSYMMVKTGMGIEGVAIVSVISYFIYDTIMFYFVCKFVGFSIEKFLRLSLDKLFPPLLILAYFIVYTSYNEVIYNLIDVKNEIVKFIVAELLLLVISFPFFIKIRSYIIKVRNHQRISNQ